MQDRRARPVMARPLVSVALLAQEQRRGCLEIKQTNCFWEGGSAAASYYAIPGQSQDTLGGIVWVAASGEDSREKQSLRVKVLTG
jgi:hypothetical protein